MEQPALDYYDVAIRIACWMKRRRIGYRGCDRRTILLRSEALEPTHGQMLDAALQLLARHPRPARKFNTGLTSSKPQTGGDEREALCEMHSPGCADILGQLADGRFLAVEIKVKRDNPKRRAETVPGPGKPQRGLFSSHDHRKTSSTDYEKTTRENQHEKPLPSSLGAHRKPALPSRTPHSRQHGGTDKDSARLTQRLSAPPRSYSET